MFVLFCVFLRKKRRSSSAAARQRLERQKRRSLHPFAFPLSLSALSTELTSRRGTRQLASWPRWRRALPGSWRALPFQVSDFPNAFFLFFEILFFFNLDFLSFKYFLIFTRPVLSLFSSPPSSSSPAAAAGCPVNSPCSPASSTSLPPGSRRRARARPVPRARRRRRRPRGRARCSRSASRWRPRGPVVDASR